MLKKSATAVEQRKRPRGIVLIILLLERMWIWEARSCGARSGLSFCLLSLDAERRNGETVKNDLARQELRLTKDTASLGNRLCRNIENWEARSQEDKFSFEKR
jgi:hypothetical protein